MYRIAGHLVLSLLLSSLIVPAQAQTGNTPDREGRKRPRVLVTTDININSGDPDDRQSMAHLFWYADEVEIVGLVADRLNAGGLEATLAAIDAYEKDYNAPGSRFAKLGYPSADYFRSILARDPAAARKLIIREAHRASAADPLYVLVWGSMNSLKGALFEDPTIAGNIRVLSIGTHLKSPLDKSLKQCGERNWNGGGREEIFQDERFRKMWWVENDWTYSSMFEGHEPRIMLDSLKTYGAVGRHIWEVVQPQEWAHYFRVGDTPSLLYVLDPDNPLDDPTRGSWAGRFQKPFPTERPNYYTDVDGGLKWDFANPCRTWENAVAVSEARIKTGLEERPAMYADLLRKLRQLYNRSDEIRVLLDTDANNELDDQHAIAYMLFNGDVFDVEGITVNRTSNGGDINAQAEEAIRVVKLAGLYPAMRVHKGAGGSFEEIRPHVRERAFDGSEAVDLIIREAHASQEERLVLIPVGKLTNIALALEKDPTIAQKVRIVWLGSNYPEPGEYNQVNDEGALNYILNTDVPFEIVLVRYGKPSGTDAVRASLEEVRRVMPGKGPRVKQAVVGRHGGSFTTFGDYSLDLFNHIELHGTPPSRALFDMAAVAIVKNPKWARQVTIPAPLVVEGKWVERPDNRRRITLWENFDRQAIMQDFYETMEDYVVETPD